MADYKYAIIHTDTNKICCTWDEHELEDLAQAMKFHNFDPVDGVMWVRQEDGTWVKSDG